MPTKDIIIPICCGPQLNLASDQRAKIPYRPEKTKLTVRFMKRKMNEYDELKNEYEKEKNKK